MLFYNILVRKNASLGFKNKRFQKSKNSHFSKGVKPWFWSKNGYFSNFFFKVIQARKMYFAILQNEKMPFQAIKMRSSKSRKLKFFSNGITPGFGPKMAIFPTFFFLGNIGQENVFLDILERKNAFVGYKKKKMKKSKN